MNQRTSDKSKISHAMRRLRTWEEHERTWKDWECDSFQNLLKRLRVQPCVPFVSSWGENGWWPQMPKCWWAGTDKIWHNKGFEASLQSFSSSWTSSTTENCWHSFSQKHWTALQKRKRPDDCWNLHNRRIEDFSRPLGWSGPPWNPASQWLLPLAIAPCTLWFSNTTCYGHPEEKTGKVRRYSQMSKRESTMRQSCGLQVELNSSPQLRKALYNVLLCKAKGIKKQLQGRVVQLGNHDLIHNRNEWINKEDCETLWKANWAQHTVLAWAAPNTNSFLLSANISKRIKGSLSAPGGFHMVPAYMSILSASVGICRRISVSWEPYRCPTTSRRSWSCATLLTEIPPELDKSLRRKMANELQTESNSSHQTKKYQNCKDL